MPEGAITAETKAAILDFLGDQPLDEFLAEVVVVLAPVTARHLEGLGGIPIDEFTEKDGVKVLAVMADGFIERTPITETLKVPLTDAKFKEYAILIGQASTEIGQAEDSLAAVKSQFKSRIDAAVAKRNEYASIINAGCEYKPVECQLVKDFRGGAVTIVRMDTGEIVRTRTMSIEERQRGFSFATEPEPEPEPEDK